MYYDLRFLTDELLFIKWYRVASAKTRPQAEFVDDITRRLNEAKGPVYFLSDLRLARVMDVATLQQMGQLTRHPNYGGGTAFSRDTLSNIFVRVFSRFAEPSKGNGDFFETLEEALAYLESLKPGIAAKVDWKSLMEDLGPARPMASR